MSQDVPDVLLWVPAASAILSLVAASAAWRTASITARSFRGSLRPHLRVVVANDAATGLLQLNIKNLGAGTAIATHLILIVKAHGVATYVDDGFLEPGDGLTFFTTLPGAALFEDEYMAMVSCRIIEDPYAYLAWSHEGHTIEKSGRKMRRDRGNLDLADVFKEFFPDATLAGKGPINFRIQR